jgi:drug/metabolite transporter (DMT)-like permease
VTDPARLAAPVKATFAVVVWGASFIATKVALRDVQPITIVWLRFAMGVAILGIAVAARRQFAIIPARELGYFSALGFLGVTFHQWLQSNGLVTAQATTTAWIVATTPIFIALLAWLLLKERLGRCGAIGIGLAAIGVLLVVSRGDWRALAAGNIGAPGDALILLSAPNWAIFSVLSRRGLQSHPAARMMFYVMGIGWLFITALFFAGPGLSDIAHLTLDGWLGVAFLGLACSGLAYIFWYDALQILPASQVGVFLYLEPLVAVIVAAIVLDESFGLVATLGGAIILLGVWLVNRPRRRSEPRIQMDVDERR